MSQSQRPSQIRFLVLAWLCALATLAYIHRVCLAVPAPLIQSDLCLSNREMAQIMSIFFLSYSICQIPGGRFGDRFGSRTGLTLLLILWSAATGVMGLLASFVGLWLSNMVKGIAQAGIFPCSVSTISVWFPASGKAFPSGMLGSFMSIGAIIATALTGLMLESMTWREVFLALSLPGFVVAIFFHRWFRDHPEEHARVNRAEIDLIQSDQPKPEQSESSSPYWPMIKSLQMWMICLQQFCRAAGYIFYVTWFPTFLQKTRGANLAESGYHTSMTLMGIVLGSASGGVISDWVYRQTRSRFWSRNGIAMLSTLMCAGLILVAYTVTDVWLTTSILIVASFCAGLCGPPSYTVTMDLGGRHVATVFSTMNMVRNIGATVMPILVIELVRIFSWNEALLLLVALYVVSALCWFFLRVDKGIFETNSNQASVAK